MKKIILSFMAAIVFIILIVVLLTVVAVSAAKVDNKGKGKIILKSVSEPLTCFGLPPEDPAVCSGHGQCIGYDTCQCYPGFTGLMCEIQEPVETFCFGIPQWDPTVCSGNGQCVAPDLCQCAPGWQGVMCEIQVPQCWDNDLDGYESMVCGGLDCDDANPMINPGMQEICDGLDNDCDYAIDEGGVCSQECNPADTNNDGLVGGADYNAVLTWWGQTCSCDNLRCNRADIVRDNFVGGADLTAVITWWGEIRENCIPTDLNCPTEQEPGVLYDEIGTCDDTPGNTTAHRADKEIDIKNVSQFRDPTWANGSCGPTSAAAVLEYLNRTGFSGLIDNYTWDQLINATRVAMGTTVNGTSLINLLIGIINYLNQSGFASNFTVEYYQDTNLTIGGVSVNGTGNAIYNGVNYTLNSKAPGYEDLKQQFVTNNQVIFFDYNSSRGGHTVALSDLDHVHSNADGSYNISFMNPATNSIQYGTIKGSVISRQGYVNVTLRTIVAISPKK